MHINENSTMNIEYLSEIERRRTECSMRTRDGFCSLSPNRNSFDTLPRRTPFSSSNKPQLHLLLKEECELLQSEGNNCARGNSRL